MTFIQPNFWAIPRTTPRTVRWSRVVVSPAAPVLTVAEAKLHAKLGAAVTAEDGLVASWVLAAQRQVETDTAIALLTQTWDLVGDGFPLNDGPIVLPVGPLQSVTHIKRYDSATPSVLQTILAADYLADVVSIPGRIGLADAKTWPTDLRTFQPVTLRVIVGFDAIAKIPEPLLQAVRLAIAWCAMHREPTAMELDSYNFWVDSYRPVVVA